LRLHTRVRATFEIKRKIVDDEEGRVKSPDDGGGTREEKNGGVEQRWAFMNNWERGLGLVIT
jgi:hypothetical protein